MRLRVERAGQAELIVSAAETGGVLGSPSRALGTALSRYSNRSMSLCIHNHTACKYHLKFIVVHVPEANVAYSMGDSINNLVCV